MGGKERRKKKGKVGEGKGESVGPPIRESESASASTFVMLPPTVTDGCGGDIMFSGCPSMCASGRASSTTSCKPVSSIATGEHG